MPGGFLQCRSDLPHRAHILLQVFFFTWKNHITQRVWLQRRPSADPHLLVHSTKQKQRSHVFFQWAGRGQLAHGGRALPLLMPIFPMFDGTRSILLESPQFSKGYSYPFSVKHIGNRPAGNLSSWLETDLWGDPFMTRLLAPRKH